MDVQNEKQKQNDCRESLGHHQKMTKWPDWEEATKLENGERRLEPEGKAEVSEIIIVSDVVEGLWTWTAKAVTSREKQSSREEEERCPMRTRRLEVRKGK